MPGISHPTRLTAQPRRRGGPRPDGDAALGLELPPAGRHPRGPLPALCSSPVNEKAAPGHKFLLPKRFRGVGRLRLGRSHGRSLRRAAPPSISVFPLAREHGAAVAHGSFFYLVFSSAASSSSEIQGLGCLLLPLGSMSVLLRDKGGVWRIQGLWLPPPNNFRGNYFISPVTHGNGIRTKAFGCLRTG